MKIMKLCLVSFSCLIFGSCLKILSVISPDVDTENQLELASKYNTDNIIFTTNRVFSYSVEQHDADRVLGYDMDLKVIPGKYQGGTKIKYKLYYEEAEGLRTKERETFTDSLKNFKWDITSVDEDESGVWIHPPRSYTLKQLELAPFLQVKYPLILHQTWTSKLFIGPGWEDYQGKTVYCSYNVLSISNSSENDVQLSVIEAVSMIDNKEICVTTYTFSNLDGFVEILYKFKNNTIFMRLK